MFVCNDVIVKVMFQQNHLKINKDAGVYNEYKYAGLTGLTEKKDVFGFFDNEKVQ